MIPYKQLTLANFLQIAKKNLKMTNLYFLLYLKHISILMKLSLFLSKIIFMHQRAEPVNTHYMPFSGH